MSTQITRDELHQKFVSLANKLQNYYRNADLETNDAEYNRLFNWIADNAYVLSDKTVDFSESQLNAFVNTYQQAEKEIYSKLNS